MLSRALIVFTTSILASAAAHGQACPTWTIPQPAANNPNALFSDMVFHNGKIVARGQFTSAGGQPANCFAEFNGTDWTPFGNMPIVGGRYTMASWGGALYATGTAPGTPPGPATGRGVVWNGSSFVEWPHAGTSTFDVHWPYRLFPLADGSLLVDGTFIYYDTDGIVTRRRHLTRYNGTAFTPLSTTQYGPRLPPSDTAYSVLQAMNWNGKVLFRGSGAISTGDEWNSNNIPCNNGLSTWDGSTFAPLPNPVLNGSIYDMAVFQGDIYVVGTFTAAVGDPTPLRNIARYNKATQTWDKVGNGLSDIMSIMFVGDDGSGERLHMFRQGTANVIGYNDPSSLTNDTVTFRFGVRWDGSRYIPYGSGTSSALSGNITCAVSGELGAGPAMYFGGNTLFSAGFTGSSTFVQRSPGYSPDTDGDGLLDTWELNGIDLNCDGITDLDLPAMGAHWRRKDVFVEVDSMVGRAPELATLNRVVTAFANANNVNDDGTQGVRLHLIVDPADQSIPLQAFPNTWPDFHAVKAQRFGNAADRTGPNRQAILEAKRYAFHYCIFADTYEGSGSSGVSELPGNDFMVTLGSFDPAGGTPDDQAATFMHELGHNFGLLHGGSQRGTRFNYKPNYHSIMNYAWQLSSDRDGWTLDYSRQVLPTLDEAALFEPAGIDGAAGAVAITSPAPFLLVPETGAVDWNRDDDFTDTSIADINNISGTAGSIDVLLGHHDWPNLIYNFRTSENYASGNSPKPSHTDEQLTPGLQAIIDAIGTPACPADLGIAGGLPGADGLLDNNDFIAFINYFFAADPHADLGVAGGLPGSDALYDNNDFIAFINHFFQGC